MDVGEIYRQAERLGLDIVAEVYNIILFTMDTGTESYDISEAYSECEAQRREKMEAFFCGQCKMPCSSVTMRSAMAFL